MSEASSSGVGGGLENSPTSPGGEPSAPMEPLSATDLAARLDGVTVETVRLREGAGELFSVVFVNSQLGPVYPAFQAWLGITGAPLRSVLHALGFPANGGAAMYGFFAAANDLLGHLTPVEAMAGRLLWQRDIDDEVMAFLDEPQPRRLQAVVGAAQAYAADLGA